MEKKKLSKSQKQRLKRVELVKSLMASGMNQSQIAKAMGISRQAVNQLLNRK